MPGPKTPAFAVSALRAENEKHVLSDNRHSGVAMTVLFCRQLAGETVWEVGEGMGKASASAQAKVSCEDCFFHRNMLCALSCDAPCSTFRPDHPDGLQPPRQMRFVFRQEQRARLTWAFPSAAEQAALHR